MCTYGSRPIQTKVKHVNFKRGTQTQRRRWGPAAVLTSQWSLLLHQCSDPTSQKLSWHLSPSSPHWGKDYSGVPSITTTCPLFPCLGSYSCWNCHQGLKSGSLCECQGTQTVRQVISIQRFFPFFLFMAHSPILRPSLVKAKLFSSFTKQCTTIKCIIHRG